MSKQYSECYQCKNRNVGCHSHCYAYLAFVKAAEDRREARLKKIKEEEDVNGVFAHRQRDNRRRRKGR